MAPASGDSGAHFELRRAPVAPLVGSACFGFVMVAALAVLLVLGAVGPAFAHAGGKYVGDLRMDRAVPGPVVVARRDLELCTV